ncbi:hypothetical protein [Ohtaekwangia koreensis]|uniref:DUF4488 domain-containing protein n=1 Tax=Ohtaekwangia koreensis TaxID=688867 RepID=A0A1T5M5E0_9BACT|nr:hypothetical protein [Ohtaekwangia koreensis]SKC83345.1 hypothetical protein SAMN05660236_4427 [Ohtaekwangia koreensis]
MKKTLFIICISLLSTAISYGQGQNDFSGSWMYSVTDTPYGNFYGTIILNKSGETYNGKVVNKAGKQYTLDVLRVKGNRLVFSSNVEETNSIFNCSFKGDSVLATIEVKGDKFLYKLKGKKVSGK